MRPLIAAAFAAILFLLTCMFATLGCDYIFEGSGLMPQVAFPVAMVTSVLCAHFLNYAYNAWLDATPEDPNDWDSFNIKP